MNDRKHKVFSGVRDKRSGERKLFIQLTAKECGRKTQSPNSAFSLTMCGARSKQSGQNENTMIEFVVEGMWRYDEGSVLMISRNAAHQVVSNIRLEERLSVIQSVRQREE